MPEIKVFDESTVRNFLPAAGRMIADLAKSDLGTFPTHMFFRSAGGQGGPDNMFNFVVAVILTTDLEKAKRFQQDFEAYSKIVGEAGQVVKDMTKREYKV